MDWRENKESERINRGMGIQYDRVQNAKFLVILYDRYSKTYHIDSVASSMTEAYRDLRAAKRMFPNRTAKIISQATARKHFSGYTSNWVLEKRKP